MKRASIALLSALGLLQPVVSASTQEVNRTLSSQLDEYELASPSTLRLISRQYFPRSGEVRARFIRRIALSNPHLFKDLQAAFDQALSEGQKLQIAADLWQGAASGSLLRKRPSNPLPSPTPTTHLSLNLALPTSLLGQPTMSEGQLVSARAFAALIASSDELVRAQRMEEKIAEESLRGAKGVYEAFLFTSLEREGMHLPTTAQEKLQQGNTENVFDSRENRIKTGVMFKALTGADVELSYNLTETKNSLQKIANRPSPEHKGSLGFKVNQPLLRGAGRAATEAAIAVAETEKSVARETIRQVTAQRVMEGLQSYIFSQRAQAKVELRQQAFVLASEIEAEMARQHTSGLRSNAELTESRASLALRRAQLAQAQQDREEQLNNLQVFVAARDQQSGARLQGSQLRPADPLQAPPGLVAYNRDDEVANAERVQRGVSLRPEARVNLVRIERESRKLEAARNMALPELNFTVRAGKESLDARRRAWGDYLSSEVPYETWMVGLTFKIGFSGDKKKDSEYQSSVYRKQQSELALGAVRQRIANEVRASSVVLEQALQQTARQQEIVQAQRELLALEKDLLQEGRRSVLDVKKKQLEVLLAEESLTDALAHANRASYLVSQVEGSLLSRLGLE